MGKYFESLKEFRNSLKHYHKAFEIAHFEGKKAPHEEYLKKLIHCLTLINEDSTIETIKEKVLPQAMATLGKDHELIASLSQISPLQNKGA